MPDLNLDEFKKQLSYLDPNYQEKKYLLAISGGVDSMVLGDLFMKLSLDFQVAHINYKLREKDSDLDEKLVENFCRENQIQYHLYEVTKTDNKPEHSIQEWARNIRYSYFNKIIEERNLDFIITAHHLNDHIETFFINFSRGSGIHGMTGIPAINNRIIRPLLNFTKDKIRNYALQNNIHFREDSSNYKNIYFRNKLRNVVIPSITENAPKFIQNAQNSLQYLNDAKKFIDEQIECIFKNLLISESEKMIVLNKNLLKNKSHFIQFEILKKYGFNFPKEIDKIFHAENGKIFTTKTHHLLITPDELEIKINSNIEELFPKVKNEIIIAKSIEELEKKKFVLSLYPYFKSEEPFILELDAEKIHFPLYIRKHLTEDYFYPKGMKGKKKATKFYKEKKISIFARENYWTLCDQDHILGLPPFRIDGRKAPIKTTKKIVKITN